MQSVVGRKIEKHMDNVYSVFTMILETPQTRVQNHTKVHSNTMDVCHAHTAMHTCQKCGGYLPVVDARCKFTTQLLCFELCGHCGALKEISCLICFRAWFPVFS